MKRNQIKQILSSVFSEEDLTDVAKIATEMMPTVKEPETVDSGLVDTSPEKQVTWNDLYYLLRKVPLDNNNRITIKDYRVKITRDEDERVEVQNEYGFTDFMIIFNKSNDECKVYLVRGASCICISQPTYTESCKDIITSKEILTVYFELVRIVEVINNPTYRDLYEKISTVSPDNDDFIIKDICIHRHPDKKGFSILNRIGIPLKAVYFDDDGCRVFNSLPLFWINFKKPFSQSEMHFTVTDINLREIMKTNQISDANMSIELTYDDLYQLMYAIGYNTNPPCEFMVDKYKVHIFHIGYWVLYAKMNDLSLSVVYNKDKCTFATHWPNTLIPTSEITFDKDNVIEDLDLHNLTRALVLKLIESAERRELFTNREE